MGSEKSVLAAYLGILPRTPEEKVLRLLIETGARVVGADDGSLLVYDEDDRDLVFLMSTGGAEKQETLAGQRVPLGRGVTGLAATTREVQTGAPTYKDIRQTEERGGEDGAPEAVLAAPMLIGEQLIGVLTAVSFVKGKRFSGADGAVYGAFAAIAGLVVDQHRRLESYEAGGDGVPKGLGIVGRHELEIFETVSRLVTGHPESLEIVARLLRDVEDLVEFGGGASVI